MNTWDNTYEVQDEEDTEINDSVTEQLWKPLKPSQLLISARQP